MNIMSTWKNLLSPLPDTGVEDEKRWPIPVLYQNDVISIRGKTPLGYYYSEVSSAAQKGVRRGKAFDAAFFFSQMFETGKAGQTNCLNRLLITCLEDIGPADIEIIPHVWFLIKPIFKDRSNMAECIIRVMCASLKMAQCRKSRVNDYAVHLYTDLYENNIIWSKYLGCPEYYKKMLIYNLQIKNIGYILYYDLLLWTYDMNLGENKKPKYGRYVWEAIFAVIGKNPYIDILLDIIDTCTFGIGAIRMITSQIYHLWLFGLLPSKIQENFICSDREKEIIFRVTDVNFRLGIPDYAIDKHTAKGAGLGRDINHFILHGAILVNEDDRFRALSQFYYENGLAKETKVKYLV